LLGSVCTNKPCDTRDKNMHILPFPPAAAKTPAAIRLATGLCLPRAQV
jgi:hypothetical protein